MNPTGPQPTPTTQAATQSRFAGWRSRAATALRSPRLRSPLFLLGGLTLIGSLSFFYFETIQRSWREFRGLPPPSQESSK